MSKRYKRFGRIFFCSREFGVLANRALRWNKHHMNYDKLSSFKVATFNLLAPCFKRMETIDPMTGLMHREDIYHQLWTDREAKTLEFFQKHIITNTSVIALQEYWLDQRYARVFEAWLVQNGFKLEQLARTGEQRDAVALAVKTSDFEIVARDDISLCSQSDRVALLLLLLHKQTRKYILCASTHLSFPHSIFDQLNQVTQMRTLIDRMRAFAGTRGLESFYSSIIMGDFNVEADSSVCDHLRNEGFHSCFEVCPPPLNDSSAAQTADTVNRQKFVIPASHGSHIMEDEVTLLPLTKFVSHRNHRQEELGVDHIFIRPEEPVSSGNLSVSSEDHFTCDEPLEGYQNSLERFDRNIVSTEHPPKSISIFVDECTVIPPSLDSTSWDYSFTISDHRPVSARIVFGVKRS
jgi:endonuclease/exonuclease/phosphatase family metal-dependent hydrolase